MARLEELAATVRGVVFDVDGVLTDGRIIYSEDGHELKAFHVQDGASLKLLMNKGVAVAIITGRRSPIVARRARELGIEHVKQGADNKCKALDALIAEGFPDTALAAIGDDLGDMELFAHASIALAMTVPNAHPAVLERAHYVTARAGGEGAAVDVTRLLLTARGEWDF